MVADTYPGTRKEELPELGRQPAQQGHATPREDANDNEVPAVPAIDGPTERQCGQREKEREGDTLQQAHLDIVEAEIQL